MAGPPDDRRSAQQPGPEPGHLGAAGDGRVAVLPPSQSIPDFPYAGFAESIGLRGIKVTEPGGVRGAWEQALAADRPCVLEFVTDPSVPPIPPHATLDQMEKTAEALLRGDPEAWDVVKTGIKSKVQEFLPGSRR